MTMDYSTVSPFNYREDLYLDANYKANAYATGSRPAANSVAIGRSIFDTTLNKPLWSNGTMCGLTELTGGMQQER